MCTRHRNVGKVGNVGSMVNVGKLGNVGSMGNVGKVGNVENVGNVGKVGNMGNVGNMTFCVTIVHTHRPPLLSCPPFNLKVV